MITLKIYSQPFSNMQILLTIVTILYITSPRLTCFILLYRKFVPFYYFYPFHPPPNYTEFVTKEAKNNFDPT